MSLQALFKAALEKTAITTKMGAEAKMRQIREAYEQLNDNPLLRQMGFEGQDPESSIAYKSYLISSQIEVEYCRGMDDILSYEDGVLYVDVSMNKFWGTDGEKLICAESLAKMAYFIGCCHMFSETPQVHVVMDRLRATGEMIFDHILCCKNFKELQDVLDKNADLISRGLMAGIEAAQRGEAGD